VSQDSHTPKSAPGKPSSGPLAASTPAVGVSGSSAPLNGPQTGAQRLDVQGRCPACRGASLFLGSGGHVTCARLGCPNPCAADDLLHGGQPTPAHNAGPTVREAAADDRRWWTDKYAGEGQ